MTELTELRSADAYCLYLTRRHYENFSVVSVFLPRDIRTHLARVYAFCRTTDDYGDESGPDAAFALARLDRWRSELNECFEDRPTPIHPVLIALSETIQACRMPRQPFLDLIQANVQDQTVHRYQSWEDLRGYCMLSAASVGRLVLRVFGIDDPMADSLSDDVCIGLQLANHAQDVKRDGLKGRSYLLDEIVAAAGARAGVRDLCDRADSLLRSGIALERMVPSRLRLQLALYRLGGQEVVRSTRELGYRTDLSRPVVSKWRKIRLAARAVGRSMTTIGHATPQGVA
ncbi:MAG TPA: squalene/phytoene synthase family protein [Chloroflexota bacterium]|jgi:squalene synthase HpnC|nr:squalene/phytoene synthase family protein [Chloroflexota bacterium]